MTSFLLLLLIVVYFLILLFVAYRTSKNSTNETFFIGNKNSHWLLVAFGMIGTSLSGVTFVSVPGTVANNHFSYFQVVIGYFIGYIIIAYVLLPLYYRLNLTSIYNYLQQRFGIVSHKTGALFFILSRILGATARLYLVINVLQIFVLNDLGISFGTTAFIILVMILLYTYRGGVKTIVWTDTLQTTFMLLGLVVCVVCIMSQLHLSFSDVMSKLSINGSTKIFNYDYKSSSFFVKQIIGGAFITVTMTGLDQEMMQKNISVKTLKDSQKNMLLFSVILLIVNFLFLLLGGLLYLFASEKGIVTKPDDIFPTIALMHLPYIVSVIFIVGLISALFPSADGAITALTSSFCIDILNLNSNKNFGRTKESVRKITHISFAVVFLICVLVFKWIDNKSIISVILKVAGYTYGPLLGLFSFGILTERKITDKLVPAAACVSLISCFFIDTYQQVLFGKFQIGIELLIINGLIMFLGLLIISKKS